MIYIFDGAMGTMLQEAGLTAGQCPELWNLEQPAKISAVHRAYLEAGAHIIETNTFGANRIKLSHYGLEKQVEAINQAGVKAARAVGERALIAGSVGPTGKFISPLGDLEFDEVYDIYYEQIAALDKAGVDMLIIETIIDIQEMRAALLAAKAASKRPVVCQLSFSGDGRTLTGTDAVTAATTLEALGADIIGANCSLGPAQLLPVIATLAKSVRIPVSVQPNAGMPQLVNGKTVFPMSPAEMAEWVPRLIAAGAGYLGGCCGTTPAHIRAISQAAAGHLPPVPAEPPAHAVRLSSRTQTIWLGQGFPTAVIGERINPSGRKALAESIRSHDFSQVKKEALAQVEAGAMILDVNMGVPGIDQAKAMKQAVADLSVLVQVPLSIDTTDAAALEAGLRTYPGRALINSVSAERERLEEFLPLAKKYGAAVLCLPLAGSGVPHTAAERVAVAADIIAAAFAAGLKPGDLLLDPLVLTVAADASAGQETLKTLRLYREMFGYPTVMGLSNISYGLPRRDIMNSAFLGMALAAGLDAPILNPFDQLMQDALAASAALLGHDANGAGYSARYAARQPHSPQSSAPLNSADIIGQIRDIVVKGGKEAVLPLVQAALNSGKDSLTIVENGFTQAMNEVGEAFGAGRCYLPQVMLAAETMRIGFQALRSFLPAGQPANAGKVLLATVKGDIHDLGKNIVAALMENSGFKVIDLGKDVAPEQVVAAAKEHQPDIVGLCSLMTTTLPYIDSTIAALRQAGLRPCVMVGGAVLTPEYARSSGADLYAPDAVAAVRLAKNYIKTVKERPLS
ncbi:MAG: homocysteine S-methyltransferase family protein [Negativicutes bacterium]|nr:homocysteine S-methyltransferase family protein [Negativicutes bacterium]